MTTPEGMERWRSKVALVTGASSGIGAAVAAALASSGMRVVAAARRHQRLEELRESLAQQGAESMPFVLDLRDNSSVLRCFEAIRKRWGAVSVLINNAGLGHNATLLDGEPEAWRETLEVNVLGLSLCTREAVRDMRSGGDEGHVIHISSMSGHRVPNGGGMYSATKFAVRALTEGLRQELRELGSAIRVSAISPGFVETEFAQKYHQSAELARQTYSRFPTLQPEDIATQVLHLLAQPPHVQIHDILMRPTQQPS